RAELCVVETREIGQRRRAQYVARGELGFASLARELVPWTDGEAVVAAVDSVADCGSQFARNRTLVLNGEIGNAAPGIELVRCRKCRGRTNIQARAACSATIGLGRICRHVERRENRAEEKPGPEFARNKICMLALPTQTTACSKRLFHDCSRIDENLHVA